MRLQRAEKRPQEAVASAARRPTPLSIDPVLVAIDLARRTGYAVGRFTDTKPACGVWTLPARDPLDPVGARVAALENTLIEAFDKWRPDFLVHAEPFQSRNIGETVSSFGLLGVLRAECWRRGIRRLQQPESTVRKEMLGRGTAPTEDMKALVMQWCAAQGIEVPDHNAGDAALFWRWTRDELVRQRRLIG